MASALFALAVLAALAAATLDRAGGLQALATQAAWAAFTAGIGFLVLHTGRVGRWRAVFFVTLAWAFVLDFKAQSLGLRGSLWTTPSAQEVPYCHIALASSFLNYVYYQYLALKSGHWAMWGPLSLGVLWLAVTVVIGQAWCSWGCMYGGLDDGFSRLLRRPILKGDRLPGQLRELPAAVLVVALLVSLGTLLPAFCLWVCPLKLTTGFLDPNDAVRRVQLAIFLTTAALALVLLPILSRKRIFCGLVCPFGAWQSLVGRLNPFGVKIDHGVCTGCGLCVKACPTFAIERQAGGRDQVTGYCNRCGECLDACPTAAITYTVFGRRFHSDPAGAGNRLAALAAELWDARVFFLFAALVTGGAVGSLFVPGLLQRFLR